MAGHINKKFRNIIRVEKMKNHGEIWEFYRVLFFAAEGCMYCRKRVYDLQFYSCYSYLHSGVSGDFRQIQKSGDCLSLDDSNTTLQCLTTNFSKILKKGDTRRTSQGSGIQTTKNVISSPTLHFISL